MVGFKTDTQFRECYRKIARDQWFADHEVKVTRFNSEENASEIAVVDFRKPGRREYAVRYIFDGYFIYASGDLGEAVFRCTWKATPTDKFFGDVDYIFEKLTASEDGPRHMDFNSSVCVATINSVLFGSIENEEIDKNFYPEHWDEDDAETYQTLVKAANECSSVEAWSHAVTEIDFDHSISFLDNDYWEWIYSAGNVMPPRIIGIITGLQIVSEKLREDES